MEKLMEAFSRRLQRDLEREEVKQSEWTTKLIKEKYAALRKRYLKEEVNDG